MKIILRYFKSVFDHRHEGKRPLLIVLVCFALSFAAARAYSLYVGNSFYIRGYHIHHFFYGAFALSAGGILAVASQKKRWRDAASVLIGFGMGMFADEIGLLLNCTTSQRACTYVFPDSADFLLTILFALILLLIFVDFGHKYSIRKNGSIQECRTPENSKNRMH